MLHGCLRAGACEILPGVHVTQIGADFREGDEDINFSIFRVRRFTEWPGPLNCIALTVEILTKPLVH